MSAPASQHTRRLRTPGKKPRISCFPCPSSRDPCIWRHLSVVGASMTFMRFQAGHAGAATGGERRREHIPCVDVVIRQMVDASFVRGELHTEKCIHARERLRIRRTTRPEGPRKDASRGGKARRLDSAETLDRRRAERSEQQVTRIGFRRRGLPLTFEWRGTDDQQNGNRNDPPVDSSDRKVPDGRRSSDSTRSLALPPHPGDSFK